MGASLLTRLKKPPTWPHFRAGFWGLMLDFVGRRLNKKGLVFKAFKMVLEHLVTEFSGGGGN